MKIFVRSAMLVAAAVCTLALLQHNDSARAGTPRMKWILNGPALQVLANDPGASRFLSAAQPYVIERKGQTVVPASWNAVTIRSFTSFANIQRAFQNNAIDSSVRGIMYDNEGWSFTPAAEQRDPATFVRMAAELVHEHKLLFISSPAVSITKTLAPEPEKRYDAFIRLNLAADSARYSDVFNVQAQGSELNVARYTSFVRQAAAQARSANPKIVMLAGISTNPSGQHVSADDVFAAIDATRSSVDGYWFNIPKPGPILPRLQ